MTLNSYRKGVTDEVAKEIIEKHIPDLNRNVEEYEEVWENLVEASKAKSISSALAIMVDRGPEMVLAIHAINPWKPTPSEATLLQAFVPNFVNATLLTYGTKVFFSKDGSVSEELLEHTEKVCKEVYERSTRELDAERRGAGT